MKIYLQNIVNSLKQYSESLDKQTLLINKPWTLIDSDLSIQKLIFKKDKELILSKNGQVTIGKWDYFPEAKSLLIDRGTDKILCNEGYVDESVLVLRLDGLKDKFFILANENLLPDLDAEGYLKKLYNRKNGIINRKLNDGRFLNIALNEAGYSGVGSPVNIDEAPVADGCYEIKDSIYNYEVAGSVIAAVSYMQSYTLKNGDKFVVEQKESSEFFKVGEKAWSNNEPALDGKYKIPEVRTVWIKDGLIIKIGLYADMLLLINFCLAIIFIVFFIILWIKI